MVLARLPAAHAIIPGTSFRPLEKSIPALKISKFKGPHSTVLNQLPLSFGSIRKISLSPSAPQNPKLIIHIQDVHANLEAQKNISQAVRELGQKGVIDFIALEGSFDPLDLTDFQTYPVRETIKNVADFLLEEDIITGPVHAGFVSANKSPPLIGIDHPEHYQANVDAYIESSKIQDSIARQIQSSKSKIQNKKKQIFNKDLLEFDRKVAAFRTGDLKLGKFVQYISKGAPFSPQIETFVSAYKIERTLNFTRAEAERHSLISQLVTKLDKNESSALLEMSLAYRLGQINNTDFYSYLKNLCSKNGLDLARTPAMSTYIQYVLLSDSIDSEKLFEEIRSRENDLYKTLSKTPEEKKLVSKDRYLYLASKLVQFELTPEEWMEYKEVFSSQFSIFNENWKLKTENLASFESFYSEAQARDKAITANLLNTMDKRNAKVAVLVTGGFHSQGINKILKKKGISTVTFVPKITHLRPPSADSGGQAQYLNFFTREKTPLEKLFEGEKLFLGKNGAPAYALKQLGPIQTLGQQLHHNKYRPDLRLDLPTLKSWFKSAGRWTIDQFSVSPELVSFSGSTSDRSVRYQVEQEFPTGRLTHPRVKIMAAVTVASVFLMALQYLLAYTPVAQHGPQIMLGIALGPILISDDSLYEKLPPKVRKKVRSYIDLLASNLKIRTMAELLRFPANIVAGIRQLRDSTTRILNDRSVGIVRIFLAAKNNFFEADSEMESKKTIEQVSLQDSIYSGNFISSLPASVRHEIINIRSKLAGQEIERFEDLVSRTRRNLANKPRLRKKRLTQKELDLLEVALYRHGLQLKQPQVQTVEPKTPSLVANLLGDKVSDKLQFWGNLAIRILFLDNILSHEGFHRGHGKLSGLDKNQNVEPIHYLTGMPWETHGPAALLGLLGNAVQVALIGLVFGTDSTLAAFFFYKGVAFIAFELVLTPFTKFLGTSDKADVLQFWRHLTLDPKAFKNYLNDIMIILGLFLFSTLFLIKNEVWLSSLLTLLYFVMSYFLIKTVVLSVHNSRPIEKWVWAAHDLDKREIYRYSDLQRAANEAYKNGKRIIIEDLHPEDAQFWATIRVELLETARKNSNEKRTMSHHLEFNGPEDLGDPMALYHAYHNKAKGMEISIQPDIAKAGEAWAAEYIKNWQHFMFGGDGKPTQEDVPTIFPTGDSPWPGYSIMTDWMSTWEEKETRKKLKEWGINPDLKPDVSRIIAFPMDAVFPQKRTAYYAFAKQLGDFWDRLGIPRKNQNFFYGDLTSYWDGKVIRTRQMTDAEFDQLVKDVKKRGLKINKFKDGKLLPNDPQYAFLLAMNVQIEEMKAKLRRLGGAKVMGGGMGPGYDGDGHLGFVEGDKDFDTEGFIELAHNYVLKAHAKEDGGISNRFTPDGKKIDGVITFGPADLFYRERRGLEQRTIIIGTNNNKANSTRRMIEVDRDPTAPLSVVQEVKDGTIILDEGSAMMLRIKTHPWEFQAIHKQEWTNDLIRKLFVQLSRDGKKRISNLTEVDFYKLVLTDYPEELKKFEFIRDHNLLTLVSRGSWEEHKKKGH